MNVELKGTEPEIDPAESTVVSKQNNDQDPKGNQSMGVMIAIGVFFIIGIPVIGYINSLEAWAQWLGIGGCIFGLSSSILDFYGKSQKGDVSTIDYLSYLSACLGFLGAGIAFSFLFPH